MRFSRALFPALLACSSIFGQEVVSARSGMVHFTQGQVFLDEHQLDRKSGSFPSIKEGATLRTEKGRAEILLTPGAFLRLDENSSIRMVSTELADTRLVFLSGSAILDLANAGRANNAITITYKDARAQFPEKGVYRLDADTGVLQAYSGGAEVTYDGQKTKVDPTHLFFCWLGLQTEKLGDGTEDEFYDWASDRSQAIIEDNQLAEQTGHDPGDANVDPSAQFGAGTVPYLAGPGLTSPSIGPQVYTSPYGSYAVGSTLFNPFMTFAPTPFAFGYPGLIVVRPSRLVNSQWPHSATHTPWHPISIGGSTLLPTTPRIGVGTVGVYRSLGPHVAAPRMGTVVRPSPSIGVHAVGHR